MTISDKQLWLASRILLIQTLVNREECHDVMHSIVQFAQPHLAKAIRYDKKYDGEVHSYESDICAPCLAQGVRRCLTFTKQLHESHTRLPQLRNDVWYFRQRCTVEISPEIKERTKNWTFPDIYYISFYRNQDVIDGVVTSI